MRLIFLLLILTIISFKASSQKAETLAYNGVLNLKKGSWHKIDKVRIRLLDVSLQDTSYQNDYGFKVREVRTQMLVEVRHRGKRLKIKTGSVCELMDDATEGLLTPVYENNQGKRKVRKFQLIIYPAVHQPPHNEDYPFYIALGKK